MFNKGEKTMNILPTDLQILNTIYNKYYDKFKSFSKKDIDRSSKIFIPIDITLIAKELEVDVDIIFGRLYYHLEQKYGYSHSDGSKVAFFALKVGTGSNCINFPYMASVLANLRDREKKDSTATKIAIFSLIIAIASPIISVILLLSSKPG